MAQSTRKSHSSSSRAHAESKKDRNGLHSIDLSRTAERYPSKRIPYPTTKEVVSYQNEQDEQDEQDEPQSPAFIRRQDSGYESLGPRSPSPHRDSKNKKGGNDSSGNSTRRRTSTTNTLGSVVSSHSHNHNHSSRARSSTRPPLRRSALPESASRKSMTAKRSSSRSGHGHGVSQVPTAAASHHVYTYDMSSGSYRGQAQGPPSSSSSRAATSSFAYSYFQFPPPQTGHPYGDEHGSEMAATTTADSAAGMSSHEGQDGQDELQTAVYGCPPATTHYWTSDQTRRLEYAAIDAATRGFKGWVMRHVVPDCFVPKEKRRVGFDDDTGSVRRYRIDLDNEEDPDNEMYTYPGAENEAECQRSLGKKKGRSGGGWW